MISHTDRLMDEIEAGTATFELIDQNQKKTFGRPFASISLAFMGKTKESDRCFAKVGYLQQGTPPSAKKIEHYTVQKVTGDGRCMFRALAIGMATNEGLILGPNEERKEADELRKAVMDAICTNEKQRRMYEEALIAITVDESINRYCGRITHPSFWGGESELLVLSRLCSQPIVVYIPESETKRGSRWGIGFVPIAEYGFEFLKPTKEQPAHKPVRLLYSGSNHYDLLI